MGDITDPKNTHRIRLQYKVDIKLKPHKTGNTKERGTTAKQYYTDILKIKNGVNPPVREPVVAAKPAKRKWRRGNNTKEELETAKQKIKELQKTNETLKMNDELQETNETLKMNNEALQKNNNTL